MAFPVIGHLLVVEVSEAFALEVPAGFLRRVRGCAAAGKARSSVLASRILQCLPEWSCSQGLQESVESVARRSGTAGKHYRISAQSVLVPVVRCCLPGREGSATGHAALCGCRTLSKSGRCSPLRYLPLLGCMLASVVQLQQPLLSLLALSKSDRCSPLRSMPDSCAGNADVPPPPKPVVPCSPAVS